MSAKAHATYIILLCLLTCCCACLYVLGFAVDARLYIETVTVSTHAKQTQTTHPDGTTEVSVEQDETQAQSRPAQKQSINHLAQAQ
jgi:hypothetical protein